MFFTALPKDLIQHIMLLLPHETILSLAQVNHFYHACVEAEWFWLALLRRDYPSFSFQEAALQQYYQEAEECIGDASPLTLLPPGPYCPRRIYLTLKYLSNLNPVSLKKAVASRPENCSVYGGYPHWWLIDLRAPLTLGRSPVVASIDLSEGVSRPHQVRSGWAVKSALCLILAPFPDSEYKVRVAPVDQEYIEGEFYLFQQRAPTLPTEAIDQDGLAQLYHSLAQEGFLLFSCAYWRGSYILPASLVENNPYFLLCNRDW